MRPCTPTQPNPTTDASVVHCATYMASSFKTSSAPEAAQSQAGGSAGKHEEGSMDVVMEGEGVAQPGECVVHVFVRACG